MSDCRINLSILSIRLNNPIFSLNDINTRIGCKHNVSVFLWGLFMIMNKLLDDWITLLRMRSQKANTTFLCQITLFHIYTSEYIHMYIKIQIMSRMRYLTVTYACL